MNFRFVAHFWVLGGSVPESDGLSAWGDYAASAPLRIRSADLPSRAALGQERAREVRYTNDARWALAIMTGLTMSLAAAVFVAALVLRIQQ